MTARFTELCIDARDPDALSKFWSEVLGWPQVGDHDPDDGYYVQIGDPSGACPMLTFQENPDAKSGKNRLHIDVNPVGRSQDEELARLLELGARRIDIGQGEQTWVVLADPEGNEFCLLAGRRD
jgi:catechol 2,3-dioxygenase-like lactoylglutathione lyase family enzyme